MRCPQCHNEEISSSGLCLVCGFRLEGPAAEADHLPADSPESETDLPQWRKELSERLRSIRHQDLTDEREALTVIAPARPADTRQPQAAKAPGRRSAPKNQVAPAPAPRQKILAPLSPKKDPRQVEQIIDQAVSKIFAASPQAQPPTSEIFIPARDSIDVSEDKWILLSRTLAGLVDLMLVILCAGVVVIASDFFSGILSLDSISFAVYGGLFLLIYLTYSVFFLSSSTQTIGMMITDLRVIGSNRKRPFIRQILVRCLGYLVSLFACGIGLAWGLIDRESRCFHDRISNTRVVRI